MTSPLSLPVVASATPPAASPRDAQARSGEDFGAALARSRSGGSSRSATSGTSAKSDETQDGLSTAPWSRRKSTASSSTDNKEHSPAELLAIALLTPAFLAASPRTAALDAPGGRTAAAGAAAQDAPAALPRELLAAAGAKALGSEDAAGTPSAEVQAALGEEGKKAADKAPDTDGRIDVAKPVAASADGAESAHRVDGASAAAP